MSRLPSMRVIRAKAADTRATLENPSERLEDIRCAIDYLTTLPAVDEERIGLLGVCAGGSYVLGVGPTEMRPKAIAAVSTWDMGMMAREGWPIVGTKAATLFMSKHGYERAAQPKQWFEVPWSDTPQSV